MGRKRSQRLNGLFPLSYLGVVPVSPVNFVIEQRPPTTHDSKNFYIGDLWLDDSSTVAPTPAPPTNEDIWMLVDLEQNVATWVNFGTGGDMQTLSGDSGTNPVFPDVNDNINVFGDNAVGLTVSGDGVSTLTITSTDGNPFLRTLTGDTGGAVPGDGAGNINIIGGTGVSVAGTPGTNTLVINATGGVEYTVQTTDATPTTLFTYSVNAGEAITIEAIIVAPQDDWSAAIGGSLVGTARRTAAGATTIVGSPIASYSEDFSGAPTYTITTSGNDVIIQVTGVAATTINWRALVRTVIQ